MYFTLSCGVLFWWYCRMLFAIQPLWGCWIVIVFWSQRFYRWLWMFNPFGVAVCVGLEAMVLLLFIYV